MVGLFGKYTLRRVDKKGSIGKTVWKGGCEEWFRKKVERDYWKEVVREVVKKFDEEDGRMEKNG